MRIGILTGGGDAPGLNGVIRALTLAAKRDGHTVIGIRRGWAGLVNPDYCELDVCAVEGISLEGGTILGTSRTNPQKIEDGYNKVYHNAKEVLKLDVLVAIGGDDTLSVAAKLTEMGFPVVGIPKTIDNDVWGTDQTFGFDTAVNIAVEAIDRLRTTAASHDRIMVVEVMGRHAGWIALFAGIACEADIILIPEIQFSIEDVCKKISEIRKRKNYAIVVVAEGATPKDLELWQTAERDAFGHVRLGGIGPALEKEIQKRTGFETRSVVLGHLQRGGPPSAYDRWLTARFGLAAYDFIKEKKYGHMVALRGTDIIAVPLKDVFGKNRYVSPELFEKMSLLFQ
ncbi:MAG: ATP-dependent 6-phosphofructokinase [Candidatus Korarchaeota archaeon]